MTPPPSDAGTPPSGAKPGTGPAAKPAAGGPSGPKPANETKAAPASGPAKAEPSPTSAKPGTTATGPKTEPAKSEAPKVEPAKADAAKSDAAKSDATRSQPGRTEPPKVEPKPSNGPKTGFTTSSSAKTSEPPLSNGPKTGFVGAGASGSKAGGTGTDGPIIDLKAKRIPDPVSATAGAAASAAKPDPAKTAASAVADKPSAAASAPASSSGGAGFGSLAAAGLIGGILGAGLLFAVEQARGPGDDSRIAALDQKIAALAPKEALTSLDKRVAANEAALKPLPEAVRNADAAAKQALAKAGAPAAGAEANGAAAQAPALPADLAARLDSLDQRVAALQEEPGREQPSDAALGATQAGDGGKKLSALDERVKALEGTGGGKAAPSDVSAKLAALQSDLDTRTKADRQADAALGQRLDQLQQNLDARVKAATEAVETATNAARQTAEASKATAQENAKGVEHQLQEQRDRLAALDKAVAQRAEAATVQAALRVVAADRIATALRTGAPYADTLAALKGFGGDASQIAPLSAFAGTGAPTAGQLAAEFRPIAEKIAAKRRAAQARSVAETGDIKQRLLGMAESIVQVRKVDAPAAATDAGAQPDTAAKVQAALDRGDLTEAASAFDALPEEARTEAGDFGSRLKARAAAGSAAQALATDAFKGLGTPTGAEPAR